MAVPHPPHTPLLVTGQTSSSATRRRDTPLCDGWSPLIGYASQKSRNSEHAGSLLSPIHITPSNLMASDTVPMQLYHQQARPLPRPPAIAYPAAHPSPLLNYLRDILNFTWPKQLLSCISFYQLLPFPFLGKGNCSSNHQTQNLKSPWTLLSLYTGCICPEADCSSPPPLGSMPSLFLSATAPELVSLFLPSVPPV